MKRIAIVLAIGIMYITLLASCFSASLDAPKGSDGPDAPLYPDANKITLNDEDTSAFIADLLDYKETILYEHSTDIRTTKDIGKVVREKLDESLPKNKWRLDIDWMPIPAGFPISASMWKTGDLRLRVLIIDDLNTKIIDMLQKKYGFEGLKAGETLIVTHVTDTSKPLPDLTATTRVQNQNVTATAEKANRLATTTAQVMTATADTAIRNATATQRTALQQITATHQTALQQITATAVAQATAQYLEGEAKKYANLSLENNFDSATLPSSWTIEREDPNRWDLTIRPGWLRIVADRSKGGEYINQFSQKISHLNMSIIAKVDIDLTTKELSDRFLRMGLASSSSEQNWEYTRIVINDGYFRDGDNVRMTTTTCQNKNCDLGNNLGSEPLTFDMLPLYIKLTVLGNKVTGYYSKDGSTWSFLGEKTLAPEYKPDRIEIEAGKGSGNFEESPMNTFVDFVHYELLDENGNVISAAVAETAPPAQTATPTPGLVMDETPVPETGEQPQASEVKSPAPQPTEVKCGNAQPSKINAYMLGYEGKHYAFVSPDGVANWMRQKPNSGGTEVDKIEPGEMVFVEQGPYCSDNKFWWYVQHRNRNTGRLYKGWTAEGDNKDYWLIPCVDEKGTVSKYCDLPK